jgi:DNA-binding MarR family transcriptional regulator
MKKFFASGTRQLGYPVTNGVFRGLPMAVAHMPECHSSHGLPDGSGRFIDDYLLYLMARASHLVSAEFYQELRRRNVSVPVWRVLASLVGSTNGETVTGLAEVCLQQQPTMTKLLDRMVRDRLVQRSQDGKDRRVVRIELTPKGAELAFELVALARRHEAEVLARHPEVEAIALKSLLRSMLERLDARASSPARRG